MDVMMRKWIDSIEKGCLKMTAHSVVSTLSIRKKILFSLLYALMLAVACIIGGELIVRAKGGTPWKPYELSVKVSPGGRFFQKSATLGYTLIPGDYAVTLPDGYVFNTTHMPNGLRATHPRNTYGTNSVKPEIWIFGCSYTYGWSLNDSETYAWLLQEQFPEYEVVNFGVNGYGTIHSLIQLKEALKRRCPPAVVIVAYASFHDDRNTFLRDRRKAIVPWNKLGPLVQPYARLDRQGGLVYSFAQVEYWEFPFMRSSALMHFLEQKYNQLQDRLCPSHKVSKALLLEFSDLSREYKFNLVVAGIADYFLTKEMMTYLNKKGINQVDISVSSSDDKYKNLPHDDHPNALANRLFADKLKSYLMERHLLP